MYSHDFAETAHSPAASDSHHDAKHDHHDSHDAHDSHGSHGHGQRLILCDPSLSFAGPASKLDKVVDALAPGFSATDKALDAVFVAVGSGVVKVSVGAAGLLGKALQPAVNIATKQLPEPPAGFSFFGSGALAASRSDWSDCLIAVSSVTRAIAGLGTTKKLDDIFGDEDKLGNSLRKPLEPKN